MFVVVSVTVFIPDVAYITPVGFCDVDVAGAAPEPKFHDQLTPADVPVFVKSTPMPVHFGAVDVKLTVGVALIVIEEEVVEEQPK